MKSLRFLIVLILSSFSLVAHAFKMGLGGQPNHENITHQAILASPAITTRLPNGFDISFNLEAVTGIEDSNRNADNKHFWDPSFHFDEEGFKESADLLVDWKNQIINNLSSNNKNPNAYEARKLLGYSLHLVQDFFAHSNWVELKKNQPSLPTPKPWELSVIQSTSIATCTHDGLISDAPLTTGWYDYGMLAGIDLGWATDDWRIFKVATDVFAKAWPANKCVHGGDEGSGLNKDLYGREGFLEAKQYATEASKSFVNEIIEELKANNDYKAICRLMDQEDNANCKYVENLGAASVSSTASTITTIDKIVLWIKDALSYIKKVRWEIFNTWGEQVDHFESTNSDPTKSFPMERMLPDSGSYTARATFFDSESITIGQSSVTFDVERSIAAFPKITITDTLDASSGNPAPIIDSITTTRFPIVTGSLSKSLDQRIGHKQTINLYDNDKLVENYVSYNDKVEWSWKPNKPLSLGVHSFRASISEMGVEGEKTAPWIVEIKDDLSKIEIPATSFVRGESVALSANGYGADTLMNAPPYGPAENAAEWDINVPSSGRYELFAIYASGESRPLSISFNGTVAFTNALSATTGGFFPANRQTLSQGFVQLSAGANIMRVFETGANVFPHIKGFSLVPAPLAAVTPEFVPIPGKNFSMGKYEVTFAEFDAYAEETGAAKPIDYYGWGRGNLPVIGVNWYEAVAYANWLSQKTGKVYRLPSEEEWEFAARAGATTNYSWGDDIGVNNAACWNCGTSWDGKQPAPVGSFKPNNFGLFDMHGNVMEWTQACSDNSCNLRVLRGGGWNTFPNALRSISREVQAPISRLVSGGFRLAQDNQAITSSRAGEPVIDLGMYGKLVAPINIDGKWFYHWDRSGDGSYGSDDEMTHDVLDNIFTQDINGEANPGHDTTEVYRFATINGVRLALPTANGGKILPNGVNTWQWPTAIDNIPSGEANPTFGDLLAIWDGVSGACIGWSCYGVSAGWTPYTYHSATPSAAGHLRVGVDYGYVDDRNDTASGVVALQVL